MIFQTFPKATVDEDRPRIDAAIARVLDSGDYILDSEVELFERAFADYIGVGHGIGVATVSHTTVAAIEAGGAQPLRVDIADGRFVMDPAQLDPADTRRIALMVRGFVATAR